MTDARPARSERVLRLAHRGDWRRAPENTIPALLAAFEIEGCDGLEFDVRVAADGTPVLLHDLTLVRVQGVDKRVDELPAAALEAHGIPTLAAALAAIDERRRGAFLDVELKGTNHGPRTAEVLTGARGDTPGEAVVSSFEPQALESMGELLPGWRRWLNVDDLGAGTIDLARRLGCHGVSVQHRAIDPSALAAARAAGLVVAGWTVRDRATFARLAGLDVFAVCVEDEALDG